MRIYYPTWAKFWSLILLGSSAVILRFDHKVVLIYRAKHLLWRTSDVTGTARGRSLVYTSWCCDWRREGRTRRRSHAELSFRSLPSRMRACGRLWLTRHVRHPHERNGERVAEHREQGGGGAGAGGPRGRRLQLPVGGRTGEAAGKVQQCLAAADST